MVRSVSSQPILVVRSNALSIIRRDSKMIQSLRISMKGQDLIYILLLSSDHTHTQIIKIKCETII